MEWVELQWPLPAVQVELISHHLFGLGALGIQEDYLPGEAPKPHQVWDKGPPPPQPKMRLLRAWWPTAGFGAAKIGVAELHQNRPNLSSPRWSSVRSSDWGEEWKKHFHRHQISDRLAVSPPWEAQEGDIIVEPGLAFGTGEHFSTRSCLHAIDQWAQPGGRCLDVGCGSGVLALAAARLGMTAVGFDVDDLAVQVAQEQALINGLQADFRAVDISKIEGRYELVVANLFAEVLASLAPDILRLSSSKIALAGILLDREELVIRAFSQAQLLRRTEEGDWVSLWYEV